MGKFISNLSEKWPNVALVALSTFIGLFLFLLDSSRSSMLWIEWYVWLSNDLFKPNYSYIAESILLPLIGKIVGANASNENYRILCTFTTLLILPVLTFVVARTFRNVSKTLGFLFLFSISFRYLWKYELGFPDPLTILLITSAAVSSHPLAIFLLIFLASLSHFSMTLVAGTALIVLHFAERDRLADRALHIQAITSIVLGLIVGRSFLAIWYLLFEYQLTTRISIVAEDGLKFFISRYENSTSAFWLTPGPPFLAIFSVMVVFFIFNKRYKLAVSLILALSLAYVSLFFTTDGLRVFAVVISGFYVRALMLFIDAIHPRCHQIFARYYAMLKKLLLKNNINLSFVAAGILVAIGWCVMLYRAKSKGLFINHPAFMTNVTGDLKILDLILIGAGFTIFFVFSISKWRAHKKISSIIKMIFFLPLTFIAIQALRQKLMPDQSLPLELLTVAMIVMIGASFVLSQINLTQSYVWFYKKISRVYASK